MTPADRISIFRLTCEILGTDLSWAPSADGWTSAAVRLRDLPTSTSAAFGLGARLRAEAGLAYRVTCDDDMGGVHLHVRPAPARQAKPRAETASMPFLTCEIHRPGDPEHLPLAIEHVPVPEIGLHRAADEYTASPGAGSSARLQIAAMQTAIAYLAATGERGAAGGILLLQQRCDELAGPWLRDLPDPGGRAEEWPPGTAIPDPAPDFDGRLTQGFYGRRV